SLAQLATSDESEAQAGSAEINSERNDRRRQIVSKLDRQLERERRDEMNGPDADAHRQRPACEPRKRGPTLGARDARGEVERGIRDDDRNRDREAYHPRCIGSLHARASSPQGAVFLELIPQRLRSISSVPYFRHLRARPLHRPGIRALSPSTTF